MTLTPHNTVPTNPIPTDHREAQSAWGIKERTRHHRAEPKRIIGKITIDPTAVGSGKRTARVSTLQFRPSNFCADQRAICREKRQTDSQPTRIDKQNTKKFSLLLAISEWQIQRQKLESSVATSAKQLAAKSRAHAQQRQTHYKNLKDMQQKIEENVTAQFRKVEDQLNIMFTSDALWRLTRSTVRVHCRCFINLWMKVWTWVYDTFFLYTYRLEI